MNLKDIKECADKTPVDSVRGVVEKQYAPADQTENDLKWSQHRQSLLIVGDDGIKLMVTLMKQPLHILDNIEGHELQLSAGRNEKGELRGLLVNRWKKRDSDYESIVVKVYPEATIRAVPPGGESPAQESPAQAETETDLCSEQDRSTAGAGAGKPASATKPAPKPPGPSQFEKEIALVGYGYCLCLDAAEKIVADRPLLQSDPGSIRAIATNLWMSSKHHVHTLAPQLHGKPKAVEKGAGEREAQRQIEAHNNQDSQHVIDRLITGHRKQEEDPNSFNEKANAALKQLDSIADQRGLWDKAYDQLLTGLVATRGSIEAEILFAANQVYDETLAHVGENANVEKFFVSGQAAWREAVLEQVGRNEE